MRMGCSLVQHSYLPTDDLQSTGISILWILECHQGIASMRKVRSGGLELGVCLQALQYLRKLCSHPLLVLDQEGQGSRQSEALAQTGSKDLHDLQHAPKLQALCEILEECGIGVPAAANATTTETPAVAEGGQHRVLVFAQLKVLFQILTVVLSVTLCYKSLLFSYTSSFSVCWEVISLSHNVASESINQFASKVLCFLISRVCAELLGHH